MTVLASIAGIGMGLYSIPQLFKIYKLKDASNVSKWAHAIIVVGAFIWMLYGLEINSIPLILSNLLGIITNGWIYFIAFIIPNLADIN